MNKKAAGLTPLVMSLVLAVLFGLFIFSFVLLAIETQNPSSEVLSSTYRLNESKQQMEGVMGNFTIIRKDVYNQLGESEPTAVDFLFLIFKGAFYIPYAFLVFIFTGIGSLTSTIFPALGGTGAGIIVSLTLGIVLSSIVVTIVLLIVKAIRTGESER